MRKYLNKPIEELVRELTAGLVRLRRGYVDSAEALLHIIDTDHDYPQEFVVFRLTGYRPASTTGQLLKGRSLRSDLLQLVLDLCDSFALKTTEYPEPVYHIPAMAKRFQVSTKTIQRWMRGGLVARKLVFPDGKRRLAVLESSIESFVRGRTKSIRRSVKFSQMTPNQRADIIRRARRMAHFSHRPLSQIARRLAERTGRAVETIRYTIRRHDDEHPDTAIFPSLAQQLKDEEKLSVYQGFLRGIPVPMLADTYRRTRGSIYRIVNEVRAQRLLRQPISCMYNPQFDLPNADEMILSGAGDGQNGGATDKAPVRAPDGLPPYLRALYEVPLLDAKTEHDLFRRYNYLKHKADRLREQIDLNHVRAGDLKRIESLLLQANMVKNRIIRANLRLVVSIAKRHLRGPMTLFELISDGNVSLMRAVEKFDYSRGHRFSTYASWAIMRNFARSVPRERHQLDRFATGHEEVLDIASSLRVYDPTRSSQSELRESIDVMLSRLSPTERSILVDHYGLNEEGRAKTLDQLGRSLGMSKERVRQIEIKALKKLRVILRPQRADLLT
ncbi:MAG TPA: sigma-70 family RNA polymerase sigma factor [Phycisphaerae bacterium]|nr:sigma-70 family RNA polymerase sigma factor [Phycisphaerae bacterium]